MLLCWPRLASGPDPSRARMPEEAGDPSLAEVRPSLPGSRTSRIRRKRVSYDAPFVRYSPWGNISYGLR